MADRLCHLAVDLGEADAGVLMLEAHSCTRDPAAHAAALREVHAMLAWVRHRWADAEGPVDDGGEWDHLLEVRDEPGGWRTVMFTLTGRAALVEAVGAAFPADEGVADP